MTAKPKIHVQVSPSGHSTALATAAMFMSTKGTRRTRAQDKSEQTYHLLARPQLRQALATAAMFMVTKLNKHVRAQDKEQTCHLLARPQLRQALATAAMSTFRKPLSVNRPGRTSVLAVIALASASCWASFQTLAHSLLTLHGTSSQSHVIVNRLGCTSVPAVLALTSASCRASFQTLAHSLFTTARHAQLRSLQRRLVMVVNDVSDLGS